MAELGLGLDQCEHVARRVAVAMREQLARLLVDAGRPLQIVRLGGLAERDLVGAAGRVAPLALDDPVDGHLRHPPPGGELAARDRYEAGARLEQLRLARDVDRLLRVARRDQRTDAGVGARQVGAVEGHVEEAVAGAEQVVDVVARRRHVLELAVVVVVGGPHQRPSEPGEREDRPAVADRHDRTGHERQRLAADRDVGAPARPDVRNLLLGVDLVGADPVGPYAGRIHDVGRPDVEAPTGKTVLAAHTARPPVFVEQAPDLAAVGHHGAEALGLPQDGEHEPRVVGLAVVEEVGRARLARRDRRQQPLDLLAVDHAVAVGAPFLDRRRATAAAEARQPHAVGRHHVVHVQPDAQHAVGALAVEGRDQQLERAHEVRREVHEQRPLEQRLADEPEVEVLEVAEAAVHELRGAARRPRGVVVTVEESHAVAARGGVESHARPRDPAADHDDVERLGLEGGQCVVPRDHVAHTLDAARRPRIGAAARR